MKLQRVIVLLLMFLPTMLMAAEKAANTNKAGNATGDEPKLISGMSITGNNETPKSLYIVPWKSSEIGSETELKSSLLNEDMRPVDRKVFMRELDFYNISVAK